MSAAQPTLTPPVDLSTQRELDALFSRDKHFTSDNIFHANVSTGVSLEYAVHTATVDGASDEDEERVLMLMGFMGEKEHWSVMVDLLLEMWPTSGVRKNLRIVTFDNRGSGGSWTGWGYNSTSIMAKDALALMDFLQWDTAHVVGVSMGGMISIELATQAPQRLRSLSLLVTTRGRWDDAVAKSYVWKALVSPDMNALVDRTVDSYYSKEFLAKPVPNAPNETMADLVRRLHKSWVDNLKPQTVGGFVGQTIAMGTHFVSDERLAAFGKATDVPILIVGCAEDTLVPPEESIKLWRGIGEKNARLVYYDKAAHCIPCQCPNQVAKELLDTITAAKKGPPSGA